jgi:hypothetical protein
VPRDKKGSPSTRSKAKPVDDSGFKSWKAARTKNYVSQKAAAASPRMNPTPRQAPAPQDIVMTQAQIAAERARRFGVELTVPVRGYPGLQQPVMSRAQIDADRARRYGVELMPPPPGPALPYRGLQQAPAKPPDIVVTPAQIQAARARRYGVELLPPDVAARKRPGRVR